MCERCNLIPDCVTDIDERNCPVYTSPSFELPIYCCLVVLLLGVLLHLGWNAVTRAVKEEAEELEVLGVVGRQIEDAVDTIVQAAVQDLPFPEESYQILHDHTGGVDLIIGNRRGKVVTIESAKSK